MFHSSSIAARLPRVIDRMRWIAVIACSLVSLFAATTTPESGARRATAPASRLTQLSSFVHVCAEEGASVTGFVITGPTDKLLLLRSVGPGLADFGRNDGLPDPVLRLFDRSGQEISRNAGWLLNRDADQIRAVTAVVGAFPLTAKSADAALLVRLAPGAYTLAVDSASGSEGAVLIEVYEAGCCGSLVNLATIAAVNPVHPGFNGSFRVTGLEAKKFLIRAIGPGLGALGIDGALPDPKLTLFREAGAAITARNDNWCEAAVTDAGPAAITAATVACGAFALPAGGNDAAVLVTLAPGAYTVQVTGKGADAGLVLLEIYAVP